MNQPPPSDGVIQFQAHHRYDALPAELAHLCVAPLVPWRARWVSWGVLGQDPARYEGAGFGNLSCRVPEAVGFTDSAFCITGTQTGGLTDVDLSHFCVVTAVDLSANTVSSVGQVLPSSEAMTHAAIYHLSDEITCVMHVHAPRLFARAAALEIPHTPADVGYGTPEMARAVVELWETGTLKTCRLLVMEGHEDGVISFGRSVDEAGRVLGDALRRAASAQPIDTGARMTQAGAKGRG